MTPLTDIFFILIILSKVTALGIPELRIPSDVLKLIISEWMDAKSLASVMRTDTIRRDIVLNSDAFEKQDLYEDIKTVLSILQMRNNSVLNAHQTLKTADTDKLIKQYLCGFDGVLLNTFYLNCYPINIIRTR